MNPLLMPLLSLAGKAFDRFFPDPAQAAEAKLKLIEMEQKGELAFLDAEVKIALGQAAINLEEAKSPSLFKSGWRPAAGWICVAGLAYQFVLAPVLGWLCLMAGISQPPAIDTGTLVSMLIGMLGLGGIRSNEKVHNVASK